MATWVGKALGVRFPSAHPWRKMNNLLSYFSLPKLVPSLGVFLRVPPFAFPVKIGEPFSSCYSLPPPPFIHPQEKGHFEKKTLP